MLTEEGIRTAPTVVEAQINSRLLTYCSGDTSEPLPLTPAGLHRPTLTLKSADVGVVLCERILLILGEIVKCWLIAFGNDGHKSM